MLSPHIFLSRSSDRDCCADLGMAWGKPTLGCITIGKYPDEELDQLGDLWADIGGRTGRLGGPGPEVNAGIGGPGPDINGAWSGPMSSRMYLLGGPGAEPKVPGGGPLGTGGNIPEGGTDGTLGPFPDPTELVAEVTDGGPEGNDLGPGGSWPLPAPIGKVLLTCGYCIALCDPCLEEKAGSWGGTDGVVNVLGAAGQDARRPLFCPLEASSACALKSLWPSSCARTLR